MMSPKAALSKPMVVLVPNVKIDIGGAPSRSSKGSCPSLRRAIKTIIIIFGILYGLNLISRLCRLGKARDERGMYCYECISFQNYDFPEPGLPVEANCLTNPKNYRECLHGAVCSFITLRSGNSTRVQRSCSSKDYMKRAGTFGCIKKKYGDFCFCNFDKCL